MNMCARRRTAAFGIILTLAGSHVAAQGTDPVVGTWVLNVAKSTFSPGPAPRSESRTYVLEEQKTRMTARGVAEPSTYTAVRQEITATSHAVDGDGTSVTREWTVVYDGKDRPITGDSNVEMISLRRIDRFTIAFSQKRAGAMVVTGTQAISRDGNVMTVTINGIDAKGQPFTDVAVFEKQ